MTGYYHTIWNIISITVLLFCVCVCVYSNIWEISKHFTLFWGYVKHASWWTSIKTCTIKILTYSLIPWFCDPL